MIMLCNNYENEQLFYAFYFALPGLALGFMSYS